MSKRHCANQRNRVKFQFRYCWWYFQFSISLHSFINLQTSSHHLSQLSVLIQPGEHRQLQMHDFQAIHHQITLSWKAMRIPGMFPCPSLRFPFRCKRQTSNMPGLKDAVIYSRELCKVCKLPDVSFTSRLRFAIDTCCQEQCIKRCLPRTQEKGCLGEEEKSLITPWPFDAVLTWVLGSIKKEKNSI